MIIEKDIKVVTPAVDYLNTTSSSFNTSGVSITVDFTNWTNRTIYLKTQTNVPIAIEPSMNTLSRDPQPHLEVRITYTLKTNGSFAKTKELMDNIIINDKILSSEARSFYEKMQQAIDLEPRVGMHHNFKFSAIRKVREGELANNKSVYLREADIVATYDKSVILKPHPNSNESFQQLDVEMNQSYQGLAGTFLRVIDNEQLVPVWYFYSGRQLIEVPPIYDESKESGVYVTISTKNEGHSLRVDTEFMTFKEAEEKIGLYKTKEEAMTYGNPLELIRLEEARIADNERKLKAELLSLRQTHEREQIQAERELANLRNSNAILKESLEIQSKRRQDLYEEMGLSRKDKFDKRDKKRKKKYEEKAAKLKWTSELIKYVPGMIIAGLGIYAATRKNT